MHHIQTTYFGKEEEHLTVSANGEGGRNSSKQKSCIWKEIDFGLLL